VTDNLFFADNTVLVNFGHIDRLDVLERVLNGRGRWCATVASECFRSSRVEGLAALRRAPAIFGDPWFPETPVERLDVLVFRDRLAGPGDPPHAHLGEAETIALMARRNVSGFVVTDDRGAARIATHSGIKVIGTYDLLRLAGRVDIISPEDLLRAVVTLRQKGRGGPVEVNDLPSLHRWMAKR